MRRRNGQRNAPRVVAVVVAVVLGGATATGVGILGPAGAAPDEPPAVEWTDPLDEEVGVALDAAITVGFSEDVTVADPGWITVVCAASGPRAGVTSGGGAEWRFDPDGELLPAEECRVTVVATAVHDVDLVDPPDTMVANVEFYFRTRAASPDVTPPVLTVDHAADGADGWHVTAPVTVAVRAADQVGVAALACAVDGAPAALDPGFTPDKAYAGRIAGGVTGDGTHAVTCEARDAAGNVTTAAGEVAIDTAPPVVAVTGIADGDVYVRDEDVVPEPGCATSDAEPGSGVATAAGVTVDVSGLDAHGLGPVVVTCAGAADRAGNAGDPATATYRLVRREVGEVLAPLASGVPGVLTRGRTVPVRFRVDGAVLAGPAAGEWTVERVPTSCADGSIDPAASPEPVGSTNRKPPRVAPSGVGEYQADFRPAAAGTCWRVRAALADGRATAWSAAFRVSH